MESVFHRYDGWPPEKSRMRVPRLNEMEARKHVHGFDLVEERGVVGEPQGYEIREYRSRETGEFRYLGGVFTGW